MKIIQICAIQTNTGDRLYALTDDGKILCRKIESFAPNWTAIDLPASDIKPTGYGGSTTQRRD